MIYRGAGFPPSCDLAPAPNTTPVSPQKAQPAKHKKTAKEAFWRWWWGMVFGRKEPRHTTARKPL